MIKVLSLVFILAASPWTTYASTKFCADLLADGSIAGFFEFPNTDSISVLTPQGPRSVRLLSVGDKIIFAGGRYAAEVAGISRSQQDSLANPKENHQEHLLNDDILVLRENSLGDDIYVYAGTFLKGLSTGTVTYGLGHLLLPLLGSDPWSAKIIPIWGGAAVASSAFINTYKVSRDAYRKNFTPRLQVWVRHAIPLLQNDKKSLPDETEDME